ncbi:ammonium transporter [Rhodococcus sp. NPDC055112]|uniref:ammonium transporter n=1 Tax=Rhodococcus maanshanensis TaxID=183556 RepID=UPI0022B46C8A|nr:ammonium transporter [Rhodococcus maanshanensis]MCZ4554855.1 ammonium transporter [Rhodococcus maanshanensis]
MRLKKFAATSLMAIAALGVGAGTSYAAPAAPETIDWSSKVEGQSVVTTIDAGGFKVSGDGKNIELQDNAGKAVVSLPLAFQLNSLKFPMEQKISEDGKTVTLTPIFDLGKAKSVTPADRGDRTVGNIAIKDIASPAENLIAQQTFGAQLAVATASGGLIGTILGCAAGALSFLVVGCVPGAGIGAIVGTIAVGGPTLIAAGIGLGQTLLAEPGTSMYAEHLQK